MHFGGCLLPSWYAPFSLSVYVGAGGALERVRNVRNVRMRTVRTIRKFVRKIRKFVRKIRKFMRIARKQLGAGNVLLYAKVAPRL